MIEPSYQRWGSSVTRYQGIDEFFATDSLELGVHSIAIDQSIVDFYLRPKVSGTLLVVFGGAAQRSTENLPPFFSGLGIAEGIDCTVVAFNDPSYYLAPDINIAWYAGNLHLALQDILPRIIERIKATTGASRVIMAGGSAGGFASLFYATKVPALAVVFNPQTNIARYNPEHTQRFAQVCFGWQGGNLEDAFEGIVFDLAEHFSQYRPPVVYMQNVSDWHVKPHTVPFIGNYGLEWTGKSQLADGLYLHVGDWGRGHIPPPREYTARVLKELSTVPGSWDEAVANAGNILAHEDAPKMNTISSS
ncbi:hypothetical protein [Pararhodobacter sp.]|uniref:hypothetical protein n=1 Tax=Pararhodobacter sp. TaxID=2127056 RepID=UPI002AFF2531|nr:hypothetical protein [Pararhodobacter sp.]